MILIGYVAKRGGKRGIENDLDLTSIYKQFDVGDPITLYCEIKSATVSGGKRKQKSPTELESDMKDHETEVKKAADKKYTEKRSMTVGS